MPSRYALCAAVHHHLLVLGSLRRSA